MMRASAACVSLFLVAATLRVATAAVSITTTSPLPNGTVGQSYSVTLAASGGTLPYKWAVGAGLPAGLALNATTGVLSGTPPAAGSFNIAIQVKFNINIFP